MSTSNFTRVENMALSGSTLLSSLNTGDLSALTFNEVMTSGNDISLVNAVSHYLTADNVVAGVNGTLRVDGFVVNSSGEGYINLGSDLSTVARSYLDLLNLTSVGQSRLLTFQLANIPLGSAIGNNINLQSGDGAAAAATALQVDGVNKTTVLFNSLGTEATDGTGATKDVVVSAVNITSGSEQVRFEVFGINRT